MAINLKEIKEKRDTTNGNNKFEQWCTNNKKRIGCSSPKFTQNKYEVYDVSFKINKQIAIGEVKVRFENYDTYFLELDKLNNLRQKRDELMKKYNLDINIYYINFVYDKAYLWDITNLNENDYNIIEKKLQKNDWDQELIYKKIIELPIEEAIN